MYYRHPIPIPLLHVYAYCLNVKWKFCLDSCNLSIQLSVLNKASSQEWYINFSVLQTIADYNASFTLIMKID